MLTHRLQDSAHLFTLPLGSDVGSNPFLQELQASLVFRNTQQFHGPFFIRRESNNFSDQITNKLIVVGLLALVVWRFLLPFNGGGLVTFVETSANFVFGRHAKRKNKQCGERLFIIWSIIFMNTNQSVGLYLQGIWSLILLFFHLLLVQISELYWSVFFIT